MNELRELLRAFDIAMRDEEVAWLVRQRVMNRLTYGNPDGPAPSRSATEITEELRDYFRATAPDALRNLVMSGPARSAVTG